MALLNNFSLTPEYPTVSQIFDEAMPEAGDTYTISNPDGEVVIRRIYLEADSDEFYSIRFIVNATTRYVARIVGSLGQTPVEFPENGVNIGAVTGADDVTVEVDRTAGTGSTPTVFTLDYSVR